MRKLLIFILFILGYISNVKINPINLDNYLKETISVEISGAVINPGIYELKLYSTLDELIDKAILSDEADISSFNRNVILQDHDVIIIPVKKENTLISLNSATLEELCTIPYVGEKTALLIIEYRSKNLFTTIEELMNIKGIGPSKFNKIKEYISL